MGWATVSRDISERKKAEAALRTSEERLRLALEAARLGTFDWDVPGNRIVWSRWHEELWGFQPGEFPGTFEAFAARVHPEDLPGIQAEIQRCLATREPYKREFRVVWPDQSMHWVLALGEFAFASDGKPERMRGVVREITERKEAEKALRILSARLMESQDEERRRLARELHDTTAQKLAALAMNLAVLQSILSAQTPKSARLLTDCAALTEAAVQEIRTLAYLLHPPVLDAVGLAEAVREYAGGFARRSEITVAVEVAADWERLPPEAELALFRLVQEGLGNVHRHSGAAAVTIRLARQADHVILELQDNGRGMTVEKLAQLTHPRSAVGVGIAGMRERLRLLGGQLEIQSSPDGTRVCATIPRRQTH